MDKINKKAKTIINNCINKKNCDINILISYFWEGASYELLYYFYNNSKNIENFRQISSILEEGPFYKKDLFYNVSLLPLLKKLIKKNDLNLVNTVFYTFSQYASKKNDLIIIFDTLKDKKNIFNSTIYWSIYSLTDTQLKKISKINNIGLPLKLFGKKRKLNYLFLKKAMLNNFNEIYNEIIVLSAMLNKLDKRDILRLSKLSKNNFLIKFVLYTLFTRSTSPDM